MQKNQPIASLLLMLLLVISGCEKQEKEERLGRYGMLDEGSPEYTAVRFMRGIYAEPTLDSAIALSTERLGRILTNYHTNRNVQRHLLDLKYDTVDIKPQESNRVARSEYAEKATITLFLSGTYGEDKIEDIRSLDLVREKGDWKVAKIHPDHFL
ncbi:hypothetical protein [Alteromonas halophila]|uniref:Lipoprotein n=1 Tax=Alteromonas halophila TaxID=516698 RepID=A0A918JPS1_9ALTE|nr:hypothetical protein [Alteromonas halophila]GGW95689.1 hypothetical protein GCM10007391_32300 [Alteromonas halophila]